MVNATIVRCNVSHCKALEIGSSGEIWVLREILVLSQRSQYRISKIQVETASEIKDGQ